MRMQSPPVNSLNMDLLTEFTATLENLEKDKSCRGVIITSVGPSALLTGSAHNVQLHICFLYITCTPTMSSVILALCDV